MEGVIPAFPKSLSMRVCNQGLFPFLAGGMAIPYLIRSWETRDVSIPSKIDTWSAVHPRLAISLMAATRLSVKSLVHALLTISMPLALQSRPTAVLVIPSNLAAFAL